MRSQCRGVQAEGNPADGRTGCGVRQPEKHLGCGAVARMQTRRKDAPVTTAARTSSGNEVLFDEEKIIVSKTDPKGRLTYVNRIFVEVSGFRRRELLGHPHSIIRHPDMPGGVFKLLWDTILAGDEIFAYVKNVTKDGGYYWVLAHVTPSFDASRRVVGFHSSRRCPDRAAITRIEPVYRAMRTMERGDVGKAAAAAASLAWLHEQLAEAGLTYEEYVWRIIHGQKSGLRDD